MAVRQKQPQRGTGRRSEVSITGTILIGAAGAITSQVSELCTAVKNAAAGRYDLTFDRVYKAGSVRFLSAMVIRPDTTSFGNTNANLVQGQAGSNAGTATLQAILASSGVDTNVGSGLSIHYEFAAQEF
jgi:hypothetical protein